MRLTRPSRQVIVNENNAHDTKDFLAKRLEAVKNSRNAGDFEELALIIGELGVESLSELRADAFAQTARVFRSRSTRT